MKNMSDHCVLDMMDFEDNWSIDEGFPADDLLEALSSELEIPQLLGGEGSFGHDESPDEIIKNAVESPSRNTDDMEMNFMPMDIDIFKNICSDGLESIPTESDVMNRIIENVKIENEIKLEPRSPRSQLPPSPSPSHSDSSGHEWHNDVSSNDLKSAFETPPISPPQSESTSPPTIINSPILQQIKLFPVKNEETTSTKFLISKGNSAKRVCINKIKSEGEQPRKTIILSAQDFAAFSQKVKQNGTPQLKIQTLPTNKTVKIQNQLNILPSQQVNLEKGTAFTPTSQVKIINAIPKVQIQNAKPIVMTKESSVCSPIINPPCTPIVIKNETPDFFNLSGRQESEIKALKRQQRMIKNRESACLSRKKKKEYVTSLENQISDLQDQNRQLYAENTVLKQRLSEFEDLSGGRSKIKNMNLHGNKKNTVMLLAVFCMITFNLRIFGVFETKTELQSMSPHMPLPNVRHSRSLLWTELSSEETNSSTNSINKTTHHPMCPMHINQTESLQLENHLRRWSKVKSNSNNANWQSNALEVFSPNSKEHEKLFDALKIKSDTDYVVWLNREYFLLPTSGQNNTFRPKMSLIFPALPLNDTLSNSPNNVTKIDCEVTKIEFLSLENAVISEYLRNQQKQNSKRQKSDIGNYRPYFIKANSPNSYTENRNESYNSGEQVSNSDLITMRVT